MGMSNDFLSQDEINALLSGGDESSNANDKDNEVLGADAITEIDKDLLGEIGNISMGSASTALYQLINQQVNITTPVVSVTTLKEIKAGFETPNIVLDIEYIKGIVGRNILIVKIQDGLVISNLMMGGDGNVDKNVTSLSEIEISAVSEAMNQMIGSAATSMATMFGRKVDISPPTSRVIEDGEEPISDTIPEEQPIVKVSFKMTIGDIVDSNIMQIFPIETAKNIVAIMTGEDKEPEPEVESKEIEQPAAQPQPVQAAAPQQQPQPQQQQYAPQPQYTPQPQYAPQPQYYQQPVDVHQAAFEPLVPQASALPMKNMDLILDVPLDISVVLGRTKKSIQDILNLSTGSLIELEKLAEEPVEILVNGKQIALGEVVVVDENFGVRITSIVSDAERMRFLK